MGHKKHKKKFYTQKNPSPQYQPIVHHKQRNGMSAGRKLVLAFFSLILVGGIAYWGFSTRGLRSPSGSQSTPGPQSTPTGQPSYPQNVAGIFYSSSALSAGGTATYLPATVVEGNKLTFVDLKLESPASEITYQGRTIPLSEYNGGKYLPLIVISTPSQRVIGGIRVCEPCGSFSFHIVDAKYLDCDSCHTKWDIETMKGVSGGCPNYPPPQLPTSIASAVTIDLSSLGVQVVS